MINGGLRRPVAAALAAAIAVLPLAATGTARAAAPPTPAPAPAAVAPVDRGDLLAVASLDQGMTGDEVTAYLTDFGLEDWPVRAGVDAYRIAYQTIDLAGRATTASGVVAVPRATATGEPLELVAWLHGTRVFRGEVASMDPDSDDRRYVAAFAAAGYAVVAPDYLGLGASPGTHPWMDASSLASASLDAVRAARELLTDRAFAVEPDVLVSGFSEGGSGAMALGRALEREGGPELGLGALAPISGGYGWSAWVRSAATGGVGPRAATVYLGYLTVAWNREHRLYGDPAQAFRSPYDETVETLFDNDHRIEEILAGLPTRPSRLLTRAFLEQLTEPTGRLARAMREADGVCSWRPPVAVELFAATGDHEMPIASSEHCERELVAAGAAVTLTDVGDTDHFGSTLASLPLVLRAFG